MRSARLLVVMLVFIGSTIGWAAGAKLGRPIAIVGSVFGMALGWALGRSIYRKLF